MFQLTQYASAKESDVQQITDLDAVLKTIKEGDENLNIIKKARALGKGNPKYTIIKTNLLPTFRFNFFFQDKASNNTITAPTGLIYLDADNVQEIPDSPYVLAKWKSLSDKGYGILIKVTGLTLDNYKDTYNHLSQLVGITSDAGARKATQQTILSYDPRLYHNADAMVYDCHDYKKVQRLPIEKKEKCIGTECTFLKYNEGTIRFNNIGDYFTDDTPYIVFNEKVLICSPFIPQRIEEGKRNSILFFLLSQYALLNIGAGKPFLRSIAETINKKMYPNLSGSEINAVVDSVFRKREENTLQLHYNQERRILFNPSVRLTHKEKMRIVNTEQGKRKSNLTKDMIYLVLQDWDFPTDGKITQVKVAAKCERHVNTIKNYWSDFKDYIRYISPNKEIALKKAEVDPENALPQPLQYSLNEEINLYDVLPSISFTIDESMTIIADLDCGTVLMGELVKYIGKQRKEQQYNDYKGVPITPDRIHLLRNAIAS